jgi:serine protease Do
MRRFTINSRQAILSVAVTTLALIAGQAQANPKVYERTLKSTAWVVSPITKDRTSYGTGTLIDAKRKWVLTNFHVVEGRKQAVVFFPAYRNADQVVSDPKYYVKQIERLGMPGEVIARDRKRDLALIELQKLPGNVPELPLAIRSAKPGESVHAIGSSGIQDGTLWRYSKGDVRQVYATKFKAKNSDGSLLEIDATVVETQVPTNQGDSGGPVVNDKSELVAVTQSNDLKQRLVSYSIDVREVREFVRSARTTKDTASKKK